MARRKRPDNYVKLAMQQCWRACQAGPQRYTSPEQTIHLLREEREGGCWDSGHSARPAPPRAKPCSLDAAESLPRGPSALLESAVTRTVCKVNTVPSPPPEETPSSQPAPHGWATSSPPSPVARWKCARGLLGVGKQLRRDSSSVKATGETEQRQGRAGPQTPESSSRGSSYSRDYRHRAGEAGKKGPVGTVHGNNTDVDWLGLVYASRGLAAACREVLAWQHLSCGLSRDF